MFLRQCIPHFVRSSLSQGFPPQLTSRTLAFSYNNKRVMQSAEGTVAGKDSEVFNVTLPQTQETELEYYGVIKSRGSKDCRSSPAWGSRACLWSRTARCDLQLCHLSFHDPLVSQLQTGTVIMLTQRPALRTSSCEALRAVPGSGGVLRGRYEMQTLDSVGECF